MILKPIFVVVLLSILSQGCTVLSSHSKSSAQMGDLILAEPLPVNLRSQMALARLSEILALSDDFNEEDTDNNRMRMQRAELLFQRGVLYDSVGLNGMAQYDFNRALRLNPSMADAHNFLGIHYTQQMNFIQAYDEFDSALDINPDHDYVFLNRGIALYYGGRPELAVQDFGTFYERDQSDPYRALWTYIAEKELDNKAALKHLAEIRQHLDNTHWATSLVDFYLGRVKESFILSMLTQGVSNQKQLTDKLCEAYFYLGKYHRDQGQAGVAANYFKLALSTNVYEFVEHRYARLELNLLRERTFEDDNVIE
ncbi:lipoprotein NlpI [Alteromonadaceae bacterium BrNp21-10]|nr:lipoprotein NlpI [Alteromonadaceae bacterium BrNp21-10]